MRDVAKHEMTQIYVDRSIDFMRRNKDKSFYLHVWLNDVHDRFYPAAGSDAEIRRTSRRISTCSSTTSVLDEMDRQCGTVVR